VTDASFPSLPTTSADILLRRCSLEDTEALFDAATESIDRMYPWLPWCHPGYTIEESRGWLAEQVVAFETHEAYSFGVIGRDGAYLGGCGLNRIDSVNRRANLGYWVRSSAVGRGIASRAVKLIRDWAFSNTDLIRLEIVVAADNIASLRVAEKVGALREGILRRRIFLHGVAHDAVLFAFTREP
jgi:ribosomal-protein-serine acetyltransferase